MSIQDFIKLLEGLGIVIPIYPYAFPKKAPEVAMTIQLPQTFNSTGSVYDGAFTITVRAGHPEQAEAISADVIEKLHLLTNTPIGEAHIIMIKSLQLVPYWLGEDNNLHYYSNNFQALIDKGEK